MINTLKQPNVYILNQERITLPDILVKYVHETAKY